MLRARKSRRARRSVSDGSLRIESRLFKPFAAPDLRPGGFTIALGALLLSIVGFDLPVGTAD